MIAWPRSAQLATAFLLGLATALLAGHSYGYLRYGTRPTELERESAPTYQVDLNEAERAELLQLPGVGPNLAQRILEYRQAHHGFRTVDELARVRGVGLITLERLRPWVCVSAVEEPEEDPDEATIPVKITPPIRKGSSPGKAAGGKEDAIDGRVININRATVDELMQLPGIGPKRAEQIMQERRKKPFQSVDDLRRVPGIGPKTLDRLRPHVTVGGPLHVAAAEQD
jgi:competence protein ComEA